MVMKMNVEVRRRPKNQIVLSPLFGKTLNNEYVFGGGTYCTFIMYHILILV